jgi:hypothetical protein
MYVVRAITEHLDQLLATFMLAVIFIYIFTSILGMYYGVLFDDKDTDGLPVCSLFKGCFVTTLDLGLRNGGGIGDSMHLIDISSTTYNYYGKLVFNIGFFMFVNIISLNVIFGIIIDTFSELRTKQREREWDHLNNCDICGIERRLFEKKGVDFTFHKAVEHNLWDYVFYLVYLGSLDVQSLTGFEHFVLMKFKEKSTVWLPIGSTIFLHEAAAEDSQQMFHKELHALQLKLEERIDAKFCQTNRSIEELRALLIEMAQNGGRLSQSTLIAQAMQNTNRNSGET